MSSIAGNLEVIRERMARAAARSGRRPEDVTLIAVTKLHDVSEIMEAIGCGVTDIAENKVQEVLRKYDGIQAPVRWHLIGHLQTNKVRQIVDKVDMIHSVDSLHLAQEIEKRCLALGRTMDILVQVNAAGEEQKSGIAPREAEALLGAILDSCPSLRVRGLMCMAPYSEDPEDARPCFREVRALFDSLSSSLEHPHLAMDVLSMGMSGDFETAIEEGATMVRIGTAIFGARDYSKSI